MSITSKHFGRTKAGEDVYEYLLENENGLQVCVLEYGCVVKNIFVPDKHGVLQDVVLGYNTLEQYEAGTASHGSFVGRHANRIAGAVFTLDGETYRLPANDGKNHLHGAIARHVFRGTVQGDTLLLTTHSPEGEDGFPGNMEITVSYTLTPANGLVMEYVATTDAPTLANFTNHTYFNLDGVQSASCLGHSLRIEADAFTEANAETCPTGNILPVSGTPFDFTKAKSIGREINTGDAQLRMASGYDHNFVLRKESGELTLAAVATGETSGITMKTYTTQPGIQLYTGNYLPNDAAVGKTGVGYQKHQGFCLETQHYPCAPSFAHFPSVVLRPEEEYREVTIYQFNTEKEAE